MIITLDMETYYDRQFSLTKLTTEEYIRDDRFEVIGVAVAVDDGAPEWFSGTQAETKAFLKKFDWENALALAHNTQFDGAILNWHFGIKPKGYLDTLCMARAIHGVDAGGSLKALAERYNIGEKGTEVLDALGKRRVGFTPEELDAYGRYCCNDVELTRTLFHRFMLPGLGNSFPTKELKVIDTTLKMFIQPALVLDKTMLEEHLENVKNFKTKLLESAQADIDDLMSSDRFAELLKALGVVPPTKVSARTGKEAWAFAKTDEEFKALLEHTDPRVQALVSARLGNKTTLEETRTQRFIDISSRGLLPVPIKYYAAHTGRWGGDDKINLQNLPSRGNNAGKLKKSIRAPDGYMMIDCDSSQIEARTVAWLAGQDDLVEAFDKGEDVYKIMASAIYGKDVEEISKDERFVGKTTILGAGYGMGAQKFQVQLKTFGVEIEADEANRIIQVYRKTYDKIPELWKQAQKCVEGIVDKKVAPFGAVDAVKFDPIEGGFLLPSGLWQRYDGLERVYDAEGKVQYQYKTRKGAVKIYGGKVVENLCQAIARCVIAEQMLLIGKKYRVVLTVHDAVACLAPAEEVLEAQQYVEECMKTRPSWAQTLPLSCESGVGKSYGEC
jgi:DNA polymerase I-like protein with 3'-5' exonuclease and polymerase domains